MKDLTSLLTLFRVGNEGESMNLSDVFPLNPFSGGCIEHIQYKKNNKKDRSVFIKANCPNSVPGADKTFCLSQRVQSQDGCMSFMI